MPASFSRIYTRGRAGETCRHSNGRRIFSVHPWAPPGHAAVHRAGPRAGTFAPSPEPRTAAATASAYHHFRLVSSLAPTQNVVRTFGTGLLKTKGRQASHLPNCEGSVNPGNTGHQP